MSDLLYATGNEVKFLQAEKTCEPYGITLEQARIDVSELQSDNGQTVASDKAAKAYAQLQQPLVVSDDSWMIPGLKGFPGPYVKYVNEWFTAADWLRLTDDLSDRTIVLQQVVVYQDGAGQRLFYVDTVGILLHEIRGGADQVHTNIVSFDNGVTSLGEHIEDKVSITATMHNVWNEFAEWYTDQS